MSDRAGPPKTSELITWFNMTVECVGHHTPGVPRSFDQFRVFLVSTRGKRKRLDITDYLTEDEYQQLYDEMVRQTDEL